MTGNAWAIRLPTALALVCCASPGLAEPAAKIDAADTAWMISATGFVLMMTRSRGWAPSRQPPVTCCRGMAS